MQPEDDGQTGRDQERRSVSINVSRDTLLLLGALAFLIIAVGLTFFFPLGSSNTGELPAPGATVPPGAPTAGATSAAAVGATAYPAPGASATVAGIVSSESLAATATIQSATAAVAEATAEPTGAYPEPVGTAPAQPTGQLPQPTFAPTRPTSVPVATFPPAQGTPAGAQPTTPNIPGQGTAPTPERTTGAAPTTPPQPTIPSQPTTPPQPTATQRPEPTAEAGATPAPADGKEPGPSPTPAPEVDVLRGNVRWRADQSPIVLRRDVQLAPGAVLIIEPGVEVRLDPGVSIYVEQAQLLALGLPERPIRFVSNTGVRWSGIFVQPSSYVVLENTEVRGGGAGGTVLASEVSEMVVRRSRFIDNGGTIILSDTKLELRDSEITGNDLPFNAAIEATYNRFGPTNFLTMTGNRIAGNRLSDGAPQVRISNLSALDTLNLDIQNNLMRGGIDNLVLNTNGMLKGIVSCNAFIGGEMGFSLRTQTPQIPASPQLTVVNNYIDGHVPPIVPVYLDFGIGRGAASEVPLDMRSNWWGATSGPYHPQTNPEGRGDAVGVNITYQPWLEAAPACTPKL